MNLTITRIIIPLALFLILLLVTRLTTTILIYWGRRTNSINTVVQLNKRQIGKYSYGYSSFTTFENILWEYTEDFGYKWILSGDEIIRSNGIHRPIVIVNGYIRIEGNRYLIIRFFDIFAYLRWEKNLKKSLEKKLERSVLEPYRNDFEKCYADYFEEDENEEEEDE